MSISLRDAVNASGRSSIATIRLLFESELLSGKTLIIVEGIDDRKAYARLFDENSTYIHSMDGCGKYSDILETLNPHYGNRMVAIKDADFDVLNGVEIKYANLFITDGHDAEIMMADEDFERVIQSEFLGGVRIPLFFNVEMDMRHLSYIKWINDKYQYKINVEKMHPYHELYDGNTEIPISECLKKLYDMDCNADKMCLQEDAIQLFETEHPTENYANLTNGHDLFEGICRKLYYLGENGVRITGRRPEEQDISRLARASFSNDKFKKTKLYHDINVWQRVNNYHILVE